MPTSVRFYRDVLGFEVAGNSPARETDDFDWVLLRFNGIDLMLNTAYEVDKRPPKPAANRIASHREGTRP